MADFVSCSLDELSFDIASSQVRGGSLRTNDDMSATSGSSSGDELRRDDRASDKNEVGKNPFIGRTLPSSWGLAGVIAMRYGLFDKALSPG